VKRDSVRGRFDRFHNVARHGGRKMDFWVTLDPSARVYGSTRNWVAKKAYRLVYFSKHLMFK
jgi:hypothetical protein